MRFCMDRDEYIAPGETLPAKAVSWTQADMVCSSAGKRLCTSLEWEFACEGEEGFPYPYGYERAPALCNQDRLLRDGKYRAKADLREPPHATCASPFGVRDMVGNVDEWVRQLWAKAPHRSELRGGWWMTGRNRCRANTSHHDEKYAGPQTGFRCCKDPASANAQSGGGVNGKRTAMAETAAD
jgi:formylglycine-generating enzyme required for sulfatase activity